MIGRPKSRGLRFTERFLLPFTGPADLGDHRRGTRPTDEQRARAEELGSTLRRVTGPDGRSYAVATDKEPVDGS